MALEMRSCENLVNEALEVIRAKNSKKDIPLMVDVLSAFAKTGDPQKYVLLWRLLNVNGDFDDLEKK